MWRRGPEIFAEVALPDDVRAGCRRVRHPPALLDAALHAAGRRPLTRPRRATVLPFALEGVSLHGGWGRTGPGARSLQLLPAMSALSIAGWPIPAGLPVLSVRLAAAAPDDVAEQLDTAAGGADRV